MIARASSRVRASAVRHRLGTAIFCLVLSIAALSSPASSQAPGLVAFWACDGDARDSIGSSHGTPMNGAGFGPGKNGQAFRLDGVDDFIQTPAKRWGLSDSATVTAWIKTSKPGGTILSLSHDMVQDELLLYLIDGKIAIFNHKAEHSYIARRGSTPVNSGEWVFVAGVLDGGAQASGLKIYVNGVQEEGAILSEGSPTPISDSLPRLVRIGWRANQQPSEIFNGLIDEVALHDRALTPDQIAEVYAGRGAQPGGMAASVTLTAAALSGQQWQFFQDNVFCLDNLRLAPNGTVEGWNGAIWTVGCARGRRVYAPDEVAWSVEGGTLIFRRASGEIIGRFDSAETYGGKLVLRGWVPDVPGKALRLLQLSGPGPVPPAAGDSPCRNKYLTIQGPRVTPYQSVLPGLYDLWVSPSSDGINPSGPWKRFGPFRFAGGSGYLFRLSGGPRAEGPFENDPQTASFPPPRSNEAKSYYLISGRQRAAFAVVLCPTR